MLPLHYFRNTFESKLGANNETRTHTFGLEDQCATIEHHARIAFNILVPYQRFELRLMDSKSTVLPLNEYGTILSLVSSDGFEPPLTVSETVVLPLDEPETFKSQRQFIYSAALYCH